MLKTILRWSSVEVLGVAIVGEWFIGTTGMPRIVLHILSWLVYAAAGRETALRGTLAHAAAAAAAVAFVGSCVWMIQGAPGRADTSDLPALIAALTYVATVALSSVVASVFGVFGGLMAGNSAQSRKKL